MNRRKYLATLGTGIVTTAGCVYGGDGGGELVEQTFEGDGSSLIEFDIENNGADFFELESDERVGVEVVPAADDGSRPRFELDPLIDRMKLVTTLEPGDYALDVTSDGVWSITLEEHPPINDADPPDYPLVIETTTPDVFGPFYFDGFVSISTHADSSGVVEYASLAFIDGSGETAGRVPQDNDEVVELEGPYWLEVPMSFNFVNGGDPIGFEAEFTEPE